MNICGCLLHVTLDRVQEAKREIDATPGAEVHASDDEGRLVVVVSDTDSRLASEIIMDLHQIPGIVSLTLTYHHFEDLRPPAHQPSTAGGQIHDHL